MGHELENHSINKSDEYNRPSSFIEKLGANTDTILQHFFERWGTFCAERPWLTLFLGACVVIGLGHGIKHLKVRFYLFTTNISKLYIYLWHCFIYL